MVQKVKYGTNNNKPVNFDIKCATNSISEMKPLTEPISLVTSIFSP